MDAELACLEEELEGEDLFESTAVPVAPAALPNVPNSIPNGALPEPPTKGQQLDEYGLLPAR